MKKISLLLTIVLALNFSAVTAQDTGGAGIQENGVYKTLYSAGVTISEEPETEVPGADLYLKTVKSLVDGNSATDLLTAALPMGNRAFYRILENQADKDTVKRLLKEYTKIIGDEDNNLAIFAITERGNNSEDESTTYLLPSFYKLKKSEQAAVLFHEAYMILNKGETTPAQNAYAEMAFQEFIEKKEAGSYSNKLPRVLDTLLGLEDVALFSALRADALLQTVPTLIDKDMNVALIDLFGSQCNIYFNPGNIGFLFETQYNRYTMRCSYDKSSLSDLLTMVSHYPKSYFMKEIVNFINAGHTVLADDLSYTAPKRRFFTESQDTSKRKADEYFRTVKAEIKYFELNKKKSDDDY